jgi:hypothetical protein
MLSCLHLQEFYNPEIVSPIQSEEHVIFQLLVVFSHHNRFRNYMNKWKNPYIGFLGGTKRLAVPKENIYLALELFVGQYAVY